LELFTTEFVQSFAKYFGRSFGKKAGEFLGPKGVYLLLLYLHGWLAKHALSIASVTSD
jgi:hypothetical protein